AVRPGRMVLWRTAAQMIAAHPLFGVGPDNFRLEYGSYASIERADTRTHSNNMYLEVVAGGGLAAFVAFAWFLRDAARLLRRAFRGSVFGHASGSDPIPGAMAAARLAIALHGAVDSFLSFAPTYILFALTIGFAAACARSLEPAADANRV